MRAHVVTPAAPIVERKPLEQALSHLLSQQQPNGCWEGEMVWNTMILSQYVIVRRVVGRPLDERARAQILKNFRITQRSDGSWGMHSESEGYVFFTTLAYVALRLLGLAADEPSVTAARKWLRAQPGGVLAIPSWGKYWLAFVGLYGYQGVNPCPPELYALPEWLPIHPARYYCHVRNIYMGLAFLYGSRAHADLGPITTDLRRELYEQPYEAIDFAAHRNDVAASDLLVRPSLGLRAAMEVMYQHERVHSKALRRRALDHVFDGILYEQHTSRYQGISPVNALLNLLSIWIRDPQHPELEKSLAGIEAWRWDDEREGTRYCGARSNTWDTAFALQAMLAAPVAERSNEALQAGYRYLASVQMTDELPEWKKMHRDPMRGGWCFSDGAHRWPVSDCTAEAMTAILLAHRAPGAAPEGRLTETRLREAAEFILLRQNDDGGFGTYERRRGGRFLDSINNTEMYGDCMTDKSHPECSASSVASLCMLREHYPTLMRVRIDRAVERGVAFLRTCQDADGGIRAAWGINYTYGAFHVVKGLRAAGVPASDEGLQRAARWLADKQRSDGGWGEHYLGCLERRYVEHPQSQVVMTSWALLALLEILPPNDPAIVRGVAWLRAHQLADGSFPDGALNGVFFDSAMLDYRLYRSYFPAWALGRHAALTQPVP